MKPGDLVLKVGGWGAKAEEDFTGLVIGFKEATTSNFGNTSGKRAIVITDDGIEEWFVSFCEVINEAR